MTHCFLREDSNTAHTYTARQFAFDTLNKKKYIGHEKDKHCIVSQAGNVYHMNQTQIKSMAEYDWIWGSAKNDMLLCGWLTGPRLGRWQEVAHYASTADWSIPRQARDPFHSHWTISKSHDQQQTQFLTWN